MDSDFKFDGYEPDSATVYEFYGDFFHGNPEIYKPDERNKLTKILFRDLYKNTLEREETLKKKGFKIESIWELDFKNKENKDE